MKLAIYILLAGFYLSGGNTFAQLNVVSAEVAKAEIIQAGKQVQASLVESLPTQQNGRIKPLDTLARESLLYISGKYSHFDLSPVQLYIALVVSAASPSLELIEVRDPELRSDLGFLKERRFFSLAEIQNSKLLSLVETPLSKQEQNAKLLTEREKHIIELYNQANLMGMLTQGDQLFQAIDFSFINNSHGQSAGNSEIKEKMESYLKSFAQAPEAQARTANELINVVKAQPVPSIFEHYMNKLDLEVWFNKARIFLILAFLSIFLGVAFLTPMFRNKVSFRVASMLLIVPIVLYSFGLGIRVYLTQFAPVTNMYGTMIWVAFGITLFSAFLFVRYKNHLLPVMALIPSGLTLLLTERIPLVLSPDLDPIVAVLRSNFWLSTHVTTITISYAALSLAMIFGNILLVRVWIYKDNSKFIKEYSHYAYRMIQLGCFLLTVGIILGGIWADYSWGRFWGWDPKETWALIADLGFLAILHARLVGWMTPAGILFWSPVAYLLVIMAWYGVNFILAAGLHSYGFSSGGTRMVLIFLGIQAVLLIGGVIRYKLTSPKKVNS